jgi:endonuclease/exonuclease/phosphatase family metal-dependent hydrolase
MSEIEMSIMTYNIHKGFSPSVRAFTLERIRTALHAENPSIVFLQEVIGAHARHAARVKAWPALPQLEFIARSEWPHAVYGQNASTKHGHHGNGILSKFPVRSWRNVDVSAHRFEQRGILHARIDLPGVRRDLHLFCIHFGLTARGREIQIERLARLLEESTKPEEPIIVAGDFNDWSERASSKLSRESGLDEVFLSLKGRHAPTFPSKLPVLKLDRIYFRGLTLIDARVLKGPPWRSISDHAPVLARFSV